MRDTDLNAPIALEKLLDQLTQPANRQQYEKGWAEFLARYRSFMESVIFKRCRAWNTLRLPLQMDDVVSDILCEVLENLCKNDGQALKSFQNRDSEIKFRGYLAITCSRQAGRHLKGRYLSKAVVADEIEEITRRGEGSGWMGELSPDSRWEFYEFIVHQLRSAAGRSAGNLERDIHIFQLYTLGDFDQAMITALPCLETIGHRVVDNVVNRIRNTLKEKALQEEDWPL